MPEQRAKPGASPEAVRDRLRRVRGFVFDMDGTLVLADRNHQAPKPLPGALDLIRRLRREHIPFVVFTNGSARTPAHYADKLRSAGFDVADDEMMTPASSAVDLFVRRGYRRVVALGGEGLAAPLEAAGIEVVPPVGKPVADAVLIGWYPEFTMAALEAACYAVWAGAKVFSASQVLFFATADGKTLGTSRAISAMVRDLTGCRINIIGKPSLPALTSAAHRLGVPVRELAVVGDDPELEVPMAHRGKALAIAVNTGLGDAGSYAHLPPEKRPHLLLSGVDELLSLCCDDTATEGVRR